MITWAEFELLCEQQMPGYEPRPQQRKLATAIEDSLATGEVIIGQGGTGVGKSFANLVPAVAHSKLTKQPVIVSTATKALQSQYANQDVPRLQEMLSEEDGVPGFTAAVVKGRASFVCHQKLKELTPGDVERIEQLRAEVTVAGHTGDLDDVTTPLQPYERGKVVTSSDECPGKRDCPFGDICFAEAAKARAHSANIVIVNHAALITDLKLKMETDGKAGMLPDASAVVIDESHELSNYATNTLGGEVTHRGIKNVTGEVANLTGPAGGPAVGAVLHAAEELFGHLGNLVQRERTVKLTDEAILAAENVIAGFLGAMAGLHRVVVGFPVHGDDNAAMKRKRLMKKTSALSGKLSEIITADPEDMVRWIESDEKRGVLLKYAPLHVGPFLREMIWNRTPAVLTSATVAIGSDFSFVAEQHGIDEYNAVDAGTPFDYPKQARLYVPKGCVPDAAGRGNWEMQLQITASELIPAAGGRTLLLFSSRTSMNTAHRTLTPMLRKRGFTILKQGEDTTKALAAKFKADESSVLFGLASFGTGFDVQGDALRLVIIDKMPFPVPTDVIFKARCEAIDKHARGWNDGAFMKLSVPMMALSLLQWAGRLIRSTGDEGLLVIMDSRLDTKGYGKKVRAALPAAGRLGNLGEAVDYLEELSSRRD
jgi:ATP-dependent DNA helicase DinG